MSGMTITNKPQTSKVHTTYGTSGSGKTSIARLEKAQLALAKQTKAQQKDIREMQTVLSIVSMLGAQLLAVLGMGFLWTRGGGGKSPGGGGSGPGVGPTNTAAQPRSRPQAPRPPAAPKLAGAKLSLAEITALLPRAHRKHAAAVKTVIDRNPTLYLLNPTARKATILALVANAHQRSHGLTGTPTSRVGHRIASLRAQVTEARHRRRVIAMREHAHRLAIIARTRRLKRR